MVFSKWVRKNVALKENLRFYTPIAAPYFPKKWKKNPEGCFFRDLEDFGSDQLAWLLILNGRIYFRKY